MTMIHRAQMRKVKEGGNHRMRQVHILIMNWTRNTWESLMINRFQEETARFYRLSNHRKIVAITFKTLIKFSKRIKLTLNVWQIKL